MTYTRYLSLGVLAMPLLFPPRLTKRPLADIAVIDAPSNIKSPRYKGYRDEQMGRLTFEFASTHFAFFPGGVTTYKHLLIVSVMAPDATDAEYAETPRVFPVSYDGRRTVRSSALGTGKLTITEGIYATGSVKEPAFEFQYADRARRLQLTWHAVKKEVDLETGIAQLSRMAESFRITRDPIGVFADMRDKPRKEAEDRARKLATVQDMLRRAGYGTFEPGKPVLRNGVYLEWMAAPEPRYQLLLPLGRIRAPAAGSVVGRPRPLRASGATAAPMAGSLGWREVDQGDWRFWNDEQRYLPFDGIAALLAAQQENREFVYFYYVGTVRVEEEADERLLTSLSWFLDGVPEVQRRWRAGTLVGPGTPEKD